VADDDDDGDDDDDDDDNDDDDVEEYSVRCVVHCAPLPSAILTATNSRFAVSEQLTLIASMLDSYALARSSVVSDLSAPSSGTWC
jgi:hypothetical protein